MEAGSTVTTEPSGSPCSVPEAEVTAAHHEADPVATFCPESERDCPASGGQQAPERRVSVASCLPLLLKQTVQEVSDMSNWQIDGEFGGCQT